MAAPYQGDSYQGIIDAFNTVRERQGEEKRGYDANYRGIIDAILDLRKWGDVDGGDLPPGWTPEYDEDGNIIGGNWTHPPDNGTLWFDERQGRLFVWIDDDFYQTNGADGLPHIGDNPPSSEVPGSFWYNQTTDSLYIYTGTSWSLITSNAGASTTTLQLATPTIDAFKSNHPYLPSTSELTTQEDFNTWLYSSLDSLENEIESNAGNFQVYMSDIPPTSSEEGDLWYNTTKLQMLVRYDDAWVASAIPVVLDDSFVDLVNTVEANKVEASQAVSNAINLIEQIGARPERTFGLHYDVNENAIQLSDSKGDPHSIELTGQHGVNVEVTPTGINFDASALSNELAALQQTVAESADVAALSTRLYSAEQSIHALGSAPKVEVSAFSALQDAVAALPSNADVSNRLSVLGGTLQGSLTMDNNRILGLGAPQLDNDAARKIDVDNVKAYADTNFVNKSTSRLNGFTITKSDITSAALDFSEFAVNGTTAMKFQTYGGTNDIATFGITSAPWEYAWNFDSNEDFCWIHGTNGKQVSIGKDGLTAKKLVLGNFLPNSANGAIVMNKIDVGESLAKHKEALQTIKAALIVSTSFEEFKLEVLQTINTI